LLAAGLLGWSLLALGQRRPLPRLGGRGEQRWRAWTLAGASAALVAYWAARLALQRGLGWRTFPAG
jgi:hypothetical protein